MTAISTPPHVYQYEMRQHNGQTGWDDKDKSSTTVLTRELDEEKHNNTAGPIHWQTGVRARFPWLGFGALLTILVSIAMTIVIMKTSDKKNPNQWPAYEKFEWIKAGWRAKAQLKPSVGLAIANTTSNLALAIAIGQGVTIAWWRKAMNGATVSELHNSWSFSTSVLDLLTAGKGFNLIALAALTAKLALVDNLLLQQAAGDEPGLGEISNMPVRVPILDVLPSNYGGSWSKDGEVGTLSHPFSEALYGYSTFGDLITATIDGVENHCNGECFAMVPGFGFNISCTPIDHGAKNYSITPQTALNTTTAWRNRDTVDPDKTLFSLLEVSFSPSLVGEGNSTAKWSSIQMTTSWADLQPATAQVSNLDVETCNGRIRSQTCEFRPAKVLYPLQISEQSGVTGQNTANGYRITTPWWIRTIPEDETDDGADSYGILDKGQIRGVEVLETMSYDPAFDSNIQSFASMMNSMFAGSISLQYLNGTGFIPAGDGLSAPLVGTWWTQLTSSYSSRPKSCVMGLENPSTYIMSQLNSIALRVSIELAFHSLEDLGDAKIQQLNKEKTSSVPFLKDFKAKNLYPTVIYISHWPFLWAAIASLLLCVCLVLPSYWGFWQLGRKVTLGPMEIASAFQAPVLSHPAVASGGEVAVLLKEVGERKVRYGEVEVEGSGRLGVAEPQAVKKLPK